MTYNKNFFSFQPLNNQRDDYSKKLFIALIVHKGQRLKAKLKPLGFLPPILFFNHYTRMKNPTVKYFTSFNKNHAKYLLKKYITVS